MKQRRHQRKQAVALRYDAAQDAAPKVVAKGAGHLADRIVEMARKHGVRVHEDADLAGVLAALDVNVHIPEHLFRAVAEVLAFVYRLDGRIDARGRALPRRRR